MGSLKLVGLITLAIFLLQLVAPGAAHADFVSSDRSYNVDDAKRRVDAACNAGAPVGFGAYTSDARFYNESTGTIIYNTNIVYRSCWPDSTRAFAVTGYANSGGTAFCPFVGWYGGSDTYDCVKYIGNPWYSGESGLACPGGGHDDECWRGTWYRDTYGVGQQAPRSDDYEYRTIPDRTGVIPNWSTLSRTSGSYDLGSWGAICTYYKPNNGGSYGSMCQDVYASVSWSRPWSISTGISVDRSSASVGDTIKWTHTVKNNGPYNTSNYGAYILSGYQNVNTSATATWDDGNRSPIAGLIRATRNTSRCIDIPGGSVNNATSIRVWDCNNTAAQLWVPESNRIRNPNSNKCLDVAGAATADGSNVGIYDCNGSDAQKWEYDSTTHTIKYRNSSLRTEMCLDRNANGYANDTKIQIWTCNGSDAQKWNMDEERGSRGQESTNSLNSGKSRTFTSQYKVKADDAGSKLCRRTAASRAGDSNYNWVFGSLACVDVPYKYTLVPMITNLTDGDFGEVNQPVTVRGQVINNGPTRSKPNTNWQLTQVVYKPGVAIDKSARTSRTDPCATFKGSSVISCDNKKSGKEAGNYAYPDTGKNIYTWNGQLGDLTVGSQVCYVMSVEPYTQDDNSGWSHSALYCYVIGKRPKVDILGGDLLVGRDSASNHPKGPVQVTTSVTRAGDGNSYGSWVEYGIAASGLVTGMASGSGYVGGTSSPALCTVSILTFTNSPDKGGCTLSTKIGRYTHTSTAPNVAARFPLSSLAKPLGSTVNLTDDGTPAHKGLSGLYTKAGGTIELTSSGRIAKRQWVVINAPEATVVIKGTIQYTSDPLSNIADIPQVVIIAKNILIADKDSAGKDISRVDAWLVAVGSGTTDGRVNTCAIGGTDENQAHITSKTCTAKLTVNGPVVANRLLLRRTGGAGTGAAAGDPAEVFNLRADAYIWASSYSPGTGRLPTMTTTELPPRF